MDTLDVAYLGTRSSTGEKSYFVFASNDNEARGVGGGGHSRNIIATLSSEDEDNTTKSFDNASCGDANIVGDVERT